MIINGINIMLINAIYAYIHKFNYQGGDRMRYIFMPNKMKIIKPRIDRCPIEYTAD